MIIASDQFDFFVNYRYFTRFKTFCHCTTLLNIFSTMLKVFRGGRGSSFKVVETAAGLKSDLLVTPTTDSEQIVVFLAHL